MDETRKENQIIGMKVEATVQRGRPISTLDLNVIETLDQEQWKKFLIVV